jgi:sugar phosphate isomerase/epimerase
MDDDVQEEQPPIPLDKLTRIYIKIRDYSNELRLKYEEQDKELAEELQIIEGKMLDICKSMNADSIRTEHGTIIRSVKSRYWTNDWDSMYAFINEHAAFGLLEKRLHQSHMKEFLLENPNTLPMGLNIDSEYSVVVRRSKEK